MTTYITVADVDELLGGDWVDADKKPRSVMQANAYLTALNLQGVTGTPDDLRQAGALLASVAASGNLYRQQTETGALTSKTVKADTVSVTKSYASTAGSTELLPADVQLALALLRPWRSNPMAFRVYR